jgi:hypothetical protein
MSVVADPEAVSFIAERGGRLYVWADDADLKQVHTEPPAKAQISFDQIEADGFMLFVASDIQKPETWNVRFHHLPWHHVDVLWDGHQPGPVVPGGLR